VISDQAGRSAVRKLVEHIERTERENYNATFRNEQFSHVYAEALVAKEWLRLNPASSSPRGEETSLRNEERPGCD
jgi:hypothetical protein